MGGIGGVNTSGRSDLKEYKGSKFSSSSMLSIRPIKGLLLLLLLFKLFAKLLGEIPPDLSSLVNVFDLDRANDLGGSLVFLVIEPFDNPNRYRSKSLSLGVH